MGKSLFYVVSRDEVMGDGVDDEFGEGLRIELLHDVAAMGDDGVHRDTEMVGNLLVDQAFHQEGEHFLFALCEQRGGLGFLALHLAGQRGRIVVIVIMSVLIGEQKLLDEFGNGQ